jgi:hypothetical protein
MLLDGPHPGAFKVNRQNHLTLPINFESSEDGHICRDWLSKTKKNRTFLFGFIVKTNGYIRK